MSQTCFGTTYGVASAQAGGLNWGASLGECLPAGSTAASGHWQLSVEGRSGRSQRAHEGSGNPKPNISQCQGGHPG